MIELQNENLTLCVDPLGAQMMELRSKQGAQYLWNGDAKYWRGRAPVLFPYLRSVLAGLRAERDRPQAQQSRTQNARADHDGTARL